MKKIILAVLAIGLGSSVLAGYNSEANLKDVDFCLLSSYTSDFDSASNINNTAFGLKIAAEIEKKFTLYRIFYRNEGKCQGSYYSLEMTAIGTKPSPNTGVFAYAIQFQVTGISLPNMGSLIFYETPLVIGYISKDNAALESTLVRSLSDELDGLALDYIKQNPGRAVVQY